MITINQMTILQGMVLKFPTSIECISLLVGDTYTTITSLYPFDFSNPFMGPLCTTTLRFSHF